MLFRSRILTESTKENLNINKNRNKNYVKKIQICKLELNNTIKELTALKDSYKTEVDECIKLQQENLHLIESLKEYKKKYNTLEMEFVSYKEEFRKNEIEYNNKENELLERVSNSYDQINRLKQDIIQLQNENNKLTTEYIGVAGHTNAKQKINLLQKIKIGRASCRERVYVLV